MHRSKERVVRAIDELASDILGASRRIHAHPEPAFQERFAAELLCGMLETHGLVPERGAFGLETSFRCDIGESGPTVAILSEYDALPGLGHACGHNLIAAMGLGAAIGLARIDGFGGRVRYLGTPAEERGAGKAVMAARGAFAGVDAAMMLHPAAADLEEMPSLAITAVTAVFRGRSSHAAVSPETGINALDACVSGYQHIAQLRQHITPTEKIHGIITRGGTAPNVVPDHAEALYYVRAGSAIELDSLSLRVRACLEAGALGAGATVELDWWEHPYLDLRNSSPLSRAYRHNAEALGREFLETAAIPVGVRGSTDMGNISHIVPSIHPTIGIGAEVPPPHTAAFAECALSATAEQAVLDGAKAMAMTTIDFCARADLRAAVAEEFSSRPFARDSG